jgi:hypothetical protein
MPRIMPEPRYFSMPSAVVGGADEQEDRQTVYQAIVGQKHVSATIAVALFRPKI